ncbi:MAG: nucleotide-binding protein [Gammaproteobacteria bacterium]
MSVYLFHGDRGGVGKTSTAATFVEYLESRGERVCVLDADTRNSELFAMFAPPLAQVVYLREVEGWAEFANILNAREEPNVVVSLPANIGDEIAEQSEFLAEALAGMGRHLVLFWTMNRSPQSVALLRPTLETIGRTATATVAVRNLYFGDRDRFGRWNESKTRKDFIAAGGLEMDLPDLLDSVVDATILANPTRRFVSLDGLSYAHRLVAKRWLGQCYAEYDRLAPKLGLGDR